MRFGTIMRVDDFDFELPEDLIALRPARPRDASRLLHVDEALHDYQFSDLPGLLRAGDCLVLNNTRVLPAQLTGIRRARAVGGGGDVKIDVNLHKILTATDDGLTRWAGFARPAKRLKVGDIVHFAVGFSAEVEAREQAEIILRFNCGGVLFGENLKAAGALPLPPYIARKRDIDAQDQQDYQTVYADEEGSVAAPTAGLHFTSEVFQALKARGVTCAEVTLHVGAGTFLPVSVDDTKDHKMHAEWGEISPETAEQLNQVHASGGRLIAVGTTALRLLESAATQSGEIRPFCAETDIFITPGYKFRAVDALVTNFHLPKSTLFMLVSAFAGTKKMRAAYEHAIRSKYRFYSYGDSSLLEKDNT